MKAKSHNWLRHRSVLGAMVVTAIFCGVVIEAQDSATANVVVLASKARVRAGEAIDLDITLRNTSKESFYVSGSIHPTRSAAYGQYRLQTKRRGSTMWETVQEYAVDSFELQTRPLSPEEWQVRNNLFLLEPGHAIGRRMTGTWKGLTVKDPGTYQLRVIYSAVDLPMKLDKPFLTGTILSNAVQIEVLP